MVKEHLKKQQPVVYQTLKHALVNDKVAHAYMFSGPSGTMKKEAAYLLAQSIICNQHDFACEECDVCRRIAQNEYADMKYIDGRHVSIKKDDIIKLQEEFNKTGLEAAGKKIYILDHAENATVDALNSLLKFLEEPTNDMTAILIVEAMDRVLPTIVSRCQIIPFTPLGFHACYDAVKDELDSLDAYLLAHLIHQKQRILETAESDAYQHARFVFKGMIERYFKSSYQALLFLQLEGFPAKQKTHGKESLQFVFDMLLIFFEEYLKGRTSCEDLWYQEQFSKMQKRNVDGIKIMHILMRGKDMLLKSVNIQMLIDQVLYEMKEVTR